MFRWPPYHPNGIKPSPMQLSAMVTKRTFPLPEKIVRIHRAGTQNLLHVFHDGQNFGAASQLGNQALCPLYRGTITARDPHHVSKRGSPQGENQYVGADLGSKFSRRPAVRFLQSGRGIRSARSANNQQSLCAEHNDYPRTLWNGAANGSACSIQDDDNDQADT